MVLSSGASTVASTALALRVATEPAPASEDAVDHADEVLVALARLPEMAVVLDGLAAQHPGV